jgi:hypothetical protein
LSTNIVLFLLFSPFLAARVVAASACFVQSSFYWSSSSSAGDTGYAWSENMGWINFKPAVATTFGVITAWRGDFAMPWLLFLVED